MKQIIHIEMDIKSIEDFERLVVSVIAVLSEIGRKNAFDATKCMKCMLSAMFSFVYAGCVEASKRFGSNSEITLQQLVVGQMYAFIERVKSR